MARSSLLLQGLVALTAVVSAAPTNLTKPVDYVIIGAGPAGYVVAERLTRNPKIAVTLLEAGPDESTNPLVTTPARFFSSQQWFWNYSTQPETNLGGLTPNLWQGRILGGGTGVNAMLYCRGSASVFNEWAELSGNPGLAWESLLEDFKETTHYTSDPAEDYNQVLDPNAFGDGPLEVSRGQELVSFDEPFANALKSTLDLDETDMVSGGGIGVSLGLETIRVSNRTRDYAVNAYGYQMAGRPNFRVIHHAWVQRIGFTGNTATNVTYTDTQTNEVHVIEAQEIIVAAGAINSPQLLMLSGVGPEDTLSALDIPVVANIPEIGSNLYDHHYAVMEYQTVDGVETAWQWSENATGAAVAQAEYANGSGPLGRNNGDVFGALRLPDSVFEAVNSSFHLEVPKDRPHVIYEYASTPFLQPAPNVSILAAFAAVVQPEATGFVTIDSSDYRDDPVIHSNYFGSAGDKAAITYGYKQLREIMQSESLSSFIVDEIFPGKNVTSDEDVWKAIQQSAQSWHHALGTVALGTVLDSNWRIKGLNGIRVIGSPAIPRPPTCAIQAHVYAVANRAARDIVEEDGVGL
ncbi:Pyranose dehydrogenase [Lasiodiplodia hormozganensis]|uniref:Pyranose dehydrogenase n=1 Tax=Lasiodiplodia hormozganensis TaxID=869390 RepID=A0AA40CPU7_9PEZI|nr:Pyranose dehydrogenase [Lasiodiplodia hormozganensis]